MPYICVPRRIPRVAEAADPDPERYANALASEEEIQLAERKGFNVSPELEHSKKRSVVLRMISPQQLERNMKR